MIARMSPCFGSSGPKRPATTLRMKRGVAEHFSSAAVERQPRRVAEHFSSGAVQRQTRRVAAYWAAGLVILLLVVGTVLQVAAQPLGKAGLVAVPQRFVAFSLVRPTALPYRLTAGVTTEVRLRDRQ